MQSKLRALRRRIREVKQELKKEDIPLDIDNFEDWAFGMVGVHKLEPAEVIRLWGIRWGDKYFLDFLSFLEEVYWREDI